MVSSGALSMVWEAAYSSRFELLLFVVSMLGYFILCSSRHQREEFHKKVCVVDDDDDAEELEAEEERPKAVIAELETSDADDEADAPVQLERALESVQCFDVCRAADQLTAFLEDFPEHPLAANDVQAVLDFCKRSGKDAVKDLPDLVLQHVKASADWHMFCRFINFHLDTKHPAQACDILKSITLPSSLLILMQTWSGVF